MFHDGYPNTLSRKEFWRKKVKRGIRSNEENGTDSSAFVCVCVCVDYRSEGFPERDIWFLGTLDQGSARCPELLGNRRRRLILLGGAAAPPDPPFKSAYRPPGFTGWFD